MAEKKPKKAKTAKVERQLPAQAQNSAPASEEKKTDSPDCC